MQARDAALQHDEACAGDAPGGLEVDEPELLADRDVIERRETEFARAAPAAQFDVRGLVAPVRDALVQGVGQAEYDLVEFRLHCGLLRLQCLEPARECLALRYQRRDVLALSLGLADCFRMRITRPSNFVGRDLGRLAPLLERAEPGDVEHEPSPREVSGDGVGIATEKLGVEHGGMGPSGETTAGPKRRMSPISAGGRGPRGS